MSRLREIIKRACPSLVYWRRYLRAGSLRTMSAEKVFTDTYRENAWANSESRSGGGSTLEATAIIRARLPVLVQELAVRSMLDIPCGDLNWIRNTDLGLERYIGADIVEEMIEAHKRSFAAPGREFLHLDLLADDLPRVDLILCRDCLVHLSYRDIDRALENIRRSGSTYLLTTTFERDEPNTNIVTGQWRTLNLRAKPFNFPQPIELIVEGERSYAGAYADKALGLWKIADV